MKRPRVVAIVPAAGYGKRLGLKAKKPFVNLGGRPLIMYSLKKLDASPAVKGIIVAVERRKIKALSSLAARFGIKKLIAVIAGGKTRAESVRNCIRKVDDSFDIVLIHDAARPFVDAKTIECSVKAADKYGGCIVAVRQNDTVKLADGNGFIKRTLDRDRIFRAQTPQVFRRRIIKAAYARFRRGATDDARLVEASGSARIKILEGPARNIKITTIEDLKLAEVLL